MPYIVLTHSIYEYTDDYVRTNLTGYDVPSRHLGPFVRYSEHFSEMVCSKYHRKLQQNIICRLRLCYKLER